MAKKRKKLPAKYRCHACLKVCTLPFKPKVQKMDWHVLACPNCGERRK